MSVGLWSQTTVPAGNVSGTWTAAGSPYLVQGEISIAAADQLIIEPGVVVEFQGHYRFFVYGKLLAEGSQAGAITFQASDPSVGWGGLRFIDTDTNGQDESKIRYATIKHGRAIGSSPHYRGGAFYASNSSDILVEYTAFTDNMSQSAGGALYLHNSSITLNHVEVSENNAQGSGGGIYLSSSSPQLDYVHIHNNSAVYDGGGINCFSSSPTLTRVLIDNNTTQYKGGGLTAFNNSHPQLDRVTITQNAAYQNGSGIASLYMSSVTMVNAIIWDNAAQQIFREPSGSVEATYSNIQAGSGQPYFGEGCIEADPLFADPAAGDFNLTWANYPVPDETKSPCIDRGDPSSPLDPDGTRTDMGALYFAQSGIQGTITLVGGTGEVENVEVVVDTFVTNPDENGEYFFSLPAGTYTVEASLQGYGSSSVPNVVVVDGEVTTNVDITLTYIPPGEINGTVALEGLGNVEDVEITAGGVTVNPYPVMNHYEYTIELYPGYYDVTASLPGYQDSTHINVPVQSGQITTGIDFELQLISFDGYLEGTVTLYDGPGDVTEVTVTAGEHTTNPDNSGYYSMLIPEGSYDVTASLPEYTSVTIPEVMIIADQTTSDIDMTLLNWNVISGTQYNAVVFANVTYDGEFIHKTDSNQLGVFDDDGECRGIATWYEGNMPEWDNYWDLEGYWYITVVSYDNSGNEELSLKLYNTETDQMHDCNETFFFEDSEHYHLNLTTPSPLHEQEISLIHSGTDLGWNWVSFNLQPTDPSIEAFFADLTLNDDIYQVKNQTTSATYFPPDWIGDLTTIDIKDGFKINMHNPYDPFIVEGTRVNPIMRPIGINEGWNWVSYLPEQSLPLSEALISLGTNAVQIKSQTTSATYYQGSWIGDLTYMEPGISYTLRANADGTLYYPAHDSSREVRNQPIASATKSSPNWDMYTGNESNMVVMATITDEQKNIDSAKHDVGIFDSNDICRAEGVYTNGLWYFTVRGDLQDEALHFKVLDHENDETYTTSANLTYEPMATVGNPTEPLNVYLSVPNADETISLQLAQNIPNPFNPETSISYTLPTDGRVKLSIFNVKGQLIDTLVDAYQEAGSHSVLWNASDYSSGIYFYRLHHDGQTMVRRSILLK
jgi:hypothetical protein